jgi:hypothetical protein
LREKKLTDKFAESINLAALFIRRKLKWMRLMLFSKADSTSKDVFENKPEYFEKWFFGVSREELKELAKDEEKWDEYVENCVKSHGGIRSGGSKSKEKTTKTEVKSRFSQRPPDESEDEFWKGNLEVDKLLQGTQDETDEQYWSRIHKIGRFGRARVKVTW